MENWEDVALLLAGVQGFLLALALLLTGLRQKKAVVYLGLILLLCAIELLNAWAMTIQYHDRPGAFPFWIFGSYLILPPALWLFLKSHQVAHFKLKFVHLIAFIPAVLEIFTELTAYYISKYIGYTFSFLKTDLWFFLTEGFPVIGMFVVLGSSWKELIRTTRSGSGVQWHKPQLFLLFFSILTVLWALESLLGYNLYPIIEFILCTFLFLLGYIVYFQPTFFETPSGFKTRNIPEQFGAYDDQQSVVHLKQLFERDKIYLRSRLNIEDVAKAMEVPPRYLSYLINHFHQCNFNHFVNDYRIQEVVRRMKDPKESNKTLLGIALDSGFNSKSSFNQTFKTMTGETPSAYFARSKEMVTKT